MSPPQHRPESPPYTTSDANQSIEAYQRTFWARQMAKVEEQVSLPDAGLIASSSTSAAAVAEDAGLAMRSFVASGDNSSSGALAESSKDLMDLFKPQAGQLPLARIKKVMKASDDQVKMISAEAPILFARACEIFIADLTSRSYINATSNRRRTVQRSDVIAAVSGSNLFDFLVDIVPRGQDSTKGTSKNDSARGEGGDEDDGEGEGEEEEAEEAEEGDE